jgi:hypothetical protein
MELYVSVTKSQIVSSISSQEEALALIKMMDEEQADWDFTKQVADHFIELMSKYFEHSKEYKEYLKGFPHEY